MRRFAVGLMMVASLALADEAAAQGNGSADPLGLIASAVIQPFWSSGPQFTLVELTSPVFFNFDLHGVFYSAACLRSISFPRPLTINDIEVFAPEDYGIDFNGLLVLALSSNDFNLSPIPISPTFSGSPLHSRGHWVNFLNDHIRVIDPIAVTSAETTGPIQTYSPLRSAASFTNPQESLLVAGADTTIFLICPRADVYSAELGIGGPGFPPPPPSAFSVIWVIYDNEEFVHDVVLPCFCLTPFPLTLAAFGGFYQTAPDSQPFSVVNLWYTEIHSSPSGAFTGYKGRFSVRFSSLLATCLAA
jgi:hypothetical protein